MSAPIFVFDPRILPRLRTAVNAISLGLGDCPVLTNARTDTSALVVRNSDATVNASAPTGSTGVIRGAWAGTLNGTPYIVTAWVMSTGDCAIFYQDAVTGAYTEITNAGATPNASSWAGSVTGNSRFVTDANSVVFSPQTAKLASTGNFPTDVLVISNGADPVMEWTPARGAGTLSPPLVWNKEIITPQLADTFIATPSLKTFWQVCSASSKTYYAAGSVNQASHLVFANTSADYTSANAVIKVTAGTSTVATDIGTVYFSGDALAIGGNYINIAWEGDADDILFLLKHCKIELSTENVAYNLTSAGSWHTIYDPSVGGGILGTLPTLLDIDATNDRYQTQISLANIPDTLGTNVGAAYHMRFTWIGSTPTPAVEVYILAIAGCTSLGVETNESGLPYGTAFTVTYADSYSLQESPPFVESRPNGTQQTDALSNCGGPAGPDASLTAVDDSTPIVWVKDSRVFYDYLIDLILPDDSADIPGGLNGNPDVVYLYYSLPAEIAADPDVKPLWWSTHTLRNPATVGGAKVWDATWTTQKTLIVPTYNRNTLVRNSGFPAPSDFNQPIPLGMVMFPADTRLWAGNNLHGSTQAYSELKFSDRGFFTRFRSIGDPTDTVAGSSLVFDGEKVMAGRALAAASQGGSTIYVWTDQTFNAMGNAGGYTFAGSGTGAISLSTRFRISADGTLEPGSIAEFNGTLYWVTILGEIVRYDQGTPAHISYRQVTNGGATGDLIAAVPANRRGTMQAVFNKHRYYLYLTPSGGTANTTCLIWNDPVISGSQSGLERSSAVGGYWESLDTLSGAERAVLIYDSATVGQGRRVFVYSAAGATRAYEESSADIAFEIKTGLLYAQDILGKSWNPGFSFVVKEVEAICSNSTGDTINFDITPNGGAVTYRYVLNLDATASAGWMVTGYLNPTTTPATPGWSSQISVNGTLAPGTTFKYLVGYTEADTQDTRMTT